MQEKAESPNVESPNESSSNDRLEMNRRRFSGYFSSIGLGATLLPSALVAVAQDSERVTPEMLASAARAAGLSFTPEERETIANRINGDRGLLKSYEAIRERDIPNHLAPALVFDPVPPGFQVPGERRPMRRSPVELPDPKTDEDLAFLPVTHLAKLIESRRITSEDLTKLYLSRLKRYAPKLFCVVTLTEELALRQARRADQEIANGNYRGPLHGIPWGAKDLLAVRGYPTTWGASPYKNQVIDADIDVRETHDVADVIKNTDVLYVTRVQKERFTDMAQYEEVKDHYEITPELMERAKEKMVVMHPLPRVGEIHYAVDDDPRAAYFRQVKNGMYIRMALLAAVLGKA